MNPFLGIAIPVVVILEFDAEHAEFRRVPAGDDIQAKPPATNMVGRDHLLGRENGIDEGDVDRAEGSYALGRGQQAAGPGQGLEGRALRVGLAPVAMPATDRQEKFETRLVGHFRGREIILPRGVPALGRLRQAQAARAVHAKKPELEGVCPKIPPLRAIGRHVVSFP